MEPTARRETIIDLVLTHGVITAAWIYPALYEGLTIHSAEKDLQMLRLEGLLRPFRDTNRLVYHRPTERLAALYGLHRSFGRGGGEVSVARRVGAAGYCFRYSLTRYSASDFAHAYPKLAASGGDHGHYFVDHADGAIDIGMVEVDCNTKGDVRRLIKKCENHFQVRARNEAWKQLIDAGMFHVVIVTPSAGKKIVLERKFRTNQKLLGPVYVEVLEALQPILLQQDRRQAPWQRQQQETWLSSSMDPPPSATGSIESEYGDEDSAESSPSSS